MHHTPQQRPSSFGIRMSRMAMAQTLRFARQAAARANADLIRFQRRQQALGRRRASIARGVAKLQSELRSLLAVPLDCSVHHYTNGAALFFRSNWVGRDGAARVVLVCNTLLPHSGRPAAALLWTENEIEQFDFAEESLESALLRGRLFVFPSSAAFADGEAYAMLPANFQETANGKPGHWCFATAGLFRGRPFVLGRGAAGTFVDARGHHVMLARPIHFDKTSRTWVWMGRSSDLAQGHLRFHVDLPLAPSSRATAVFQLPVLRKHPNVGFIGCTAKDDRGDPLGAVNTRAPRQFGLTHIKGTPHFFARPNQRDEQGRLVFARRATVNDSGDAVIVVPLNEDGQDVDVELPANRVTKDGSQWFVRYPNVKDRAAGLPLVLISLRPA